MHTGDLYLCNYAVMPSRRGRNSVMSGNAISTIVHATKIITNGQTRLNESAVVILVIPQVINRLEPNGGVIVPMHIHAMNTRPK